MSYDYRTLLVLGLDAEAKPHAAWFDDHHAADAIRAAELLQLHAIRLDDPDLRALTGKLTAGKVSSSGKVTCPIIGRELYDRFAQLIGTDAELPIADAASTADSSASGVGEAQASLSEPEASQAEAGAAAAADGVTSAAAAEADTWQPVNEPVGPVIADPWAALAVGSIVLATIGRADGWWEAVVLDVEPANDMLRLSWRDWPHMPAFRAGRQSVSILGIAAR